VKRLSHMPYQSYRYRTRSLMERLARGSIVLSLITGFLAALIFAFAGGALSFADGVLAIHNQTTLSMAIGIGVVDALIMAMVGKSDE